MSSVSSLVHNLQIVLVDAKTRNTFKTLGYTGTDELDSAQGRSGGLPRSEMGESKTFSEARGVHRRSNLFLRQSPEPSRAGRLDCVQALDTHGRKSTSGNDGEA